MITYNTDTPRNFDTMVDVARDIGIVETFGDDGINLTQDFCDRLSEYTKHIPKANHITYGPAIVETIKQYQPNLRREDMVEMVAIVLAILNETDWFGKD